VTGQLLTAEQVAERWQIPVSHCYRLAREGRIPSVRLGRYVRFRLDALEAFELQQSNQPQEASHG
jgi:excisionase family DNA binding protein